MVGLPAETLPAPRAGSNTALVRSSSPLSLINVRSNVLLWVPQLSAVTRSVYVSDSQGLSVFTVMLPVYVTSPRMPGG